MNPLIIPILVTKTCLSVPDFVALNEPKYEAPVFDYLTRAQALRMVHLFSEISTNPPDWNVAPRDFTAPSPCTSPSPSSPSRSASSPRAT